MRTKESQAMLKQLGLFVAPPRRTKLFGKIQLRWGGRAFLENLAFQFSFLKGDFLMYSKFNSVSTALGRLCSMKWPILHYQSISASSQRRLEVWQKPHCSVPTSCCPADVQKPFSYQTFSQDSPFSQMCVYFNYIF